jgi:hypothetical protein
MKSHLEARAVMIPALDLGAGTSCGGAGCRMIMDQIIRSAVNTYICYKENIVDDVLVGVLSFARRLSGIRNEHRTALCSVQ